MVHAVWNSQRENGAKHLGGIKAVRKYLEDLSSFLNENLHEAEFWDGFLKKEGVDWQRK